MPNDTKHVKMTRVDRKMKRQAQAIKRAVQRAHRTINEQISRLDTLLGKGKGAKRERDKLKKLIAMKKGGSNDSKT
tara:strand:- start:609 stop:836 length:228 start_codon:yes stop_codon:yes gene_type:complete